MLNVKINSIINGKVPASLKLYRNKNNTWNNSILKTNDEWFLQFATSQH